MRPNHRLTAFLARTALGMLALGWPALVARFPILLWDSTDYIRHAAEPCVENCHRSPFYSGFIAIVTMRMALPLFLVVAVQGAVTTWVLHAVLRIELGELRTRTFAAVMAGIALLSTMPWHTSQIMADFATPVLALSGYLFVFRWSDCNRWERGVTCGALVITPCLHPSHPIILAVAAAPLLVQWLRQRTTLRLLPWRRIAAVALGVVAVFALGHVASARRSTSDGGYNFVAARLAHAGILKVTLSEVCPTRHFRLCDERSVGGPISVNGFLWGNAHDRSVIDDIGGWDAAALETKPLVWHAALHHPWWNAVEVARDATTQLVHFRPTSEHLGTHHGRVEHMVVAELNARYPKEDHARLWRGQRKITWWMVRLSPLHAALGWAALLAVVIASFRRGRTRALARAALTFLVSNAVVCGALSAPFERYQSRLMPFATLVLLIGVAHMRMPRWHQLLSFGDRHP